jgi:anti-sigma B factor antagonist
LGRDSTGDARSSAKEGLDTLIEIPMSLDIRETEREGVTILSLKGRLTVGEASSVREKVSEVLAKGCNKVILDLSEVDYIDSTGLGSMVICYTTIKKASGALKLVNLNKRNIELLLLTKLHTIFEVFSDERDAVNSFFPDREIKRFDILTFVQQHQEEE